MDEVELLAFLRQVGPFINRPWGATNPIAAEREAHTLRKTCAKLIGQLEAATGYRTTLPLFAAEGEEVS